VIADCLLLTMLGRSEPTERAATFQSKHGGTYLSFSAAPASNNRLSSHNEFLTHAPLSCCAPGGALDPSEGGEPRMFRDFFRRLHIHTQILKEEHGQTMAEYGVVLAVITIGVVVALTALSGGITNALNAVKGKLP
jgi:pilus assembly protein Flp/PilA